MAMLKLNDKTNIQSGFRKIGIYPLNRNEVLNELPSHSYKKNDDANIAPEMNKTLVKLLQKRFFNKDKDESTVNKRHKK